MYCGGVVGSAGCWCPPAGGSRTVRVARDTDSPPERLRRCGLRSRRRGRCPGMLPPMVPTHSDDRRAGTGGERRGCRVARLIRRRHGGELALDVANASANAARDPFRDTPRSSARVPPAPSGLTARTDCGFCVSTAAMSVAGARARRRRGGGDHFVENRAERPDIHARIGVQPLDLLRAPCTAACRGSCPARSSPVARLASSRRPVRPRYSGLRQSEIEKLHPFLVREHIGRLQIAMRDPRAVRTHERIRDLAARSRSSRRWGSLGLKPRVPSDPGVPSDPRVPSVMGAGARGYEPSVERFPLEILHDEILGRPSWPTS